MLSNSDVLPCSIVNPRQEIVREIDTHSAIFLTALKAHDARSHWRGLFRSAGSPDKALQSSAIEARL